MRLKLGELLVQEGVITRRQLEETLKCQVIFGGKLGTNLIEQGFLPEEKLAQVLSRKLNVPFVAPDSLMDLPPEVIRLIPTGLARKYKVVPLRLEKNRLDLVMLDPADFAAIDDISFITGFIVRPFVTPEVRLMYALEKYYDVKRDMRYLRLSEKLQKQQGIPAPASAAPAPSLAPVTEPVLDPLAETWGDFTGFDGADPAASADFTRNAASRYAVDDPSGRLADASDREEVADVVMSFVASRFRHATLLVVKGDMAVGWRLVRNHKDAAGAERLQLPLAAQSILRTVIESKNPYYGRVPATVENRAVITAAGGSGDSLCLVPLVMMGRAVNVLVLVPEQDANVGKNLQEVQKILKKAAMAFQVLILRNKILMT